MKYIKVPEKCLICGIGEWSGGAQIPNEDLQPRVRVFYDCGCSLSYKVIDESIPAFQLLIKNCSTFS